MQVYRLLLMPHIAVDGCWKQLEGMGWKPLYSVEEEDVKIIFAQYEKPFVLTTGLSIYLQEVSPVELPAIDWESQWSSHGAAFKEGYVHVDLSHYSCNIASRPVLQLQPGPGFGDLSHPTTCQTLRLMSTCCAGRPFVDIGCGSGILALAAYAWGAYPITGIDIDLAALEHAQANAKHNGAEDAILFNTVDGLEAYQWQPRSVAAMNMITSEQEQAWAALKSLEPYCDDLIVSGVYGKEKKAYLALWLERGWHAIASTHQGRWHAFHLAKIKKICKNLIL